MLERAQIYLPEAGTVQAHNLQTVYECSLLLGVFVLSVVFYFLQLIVMNRGTCSKYLDHPTLEMLWSSASFCLLVVMCGVSVYALYVNDETYMDPGLDVTVVGRQWYWSYKIGLGLEDGVLEWDSRGIPRSKDSPSNFVDYLWVDRPLIVPVNTLIRVLVTSQDVIHSWGAPGMGVKIDAIPGRLNRGLFEVKVPGIYSGGCVEFCGQQHYMMPTVVEAVSEEAFSDWLTFVSRYENS